ncbi:MAG: response regulator transcription factor [Deltaproteobacteria bacterium]|jgi:two-component system, OmpR family, alkaline phosphatase synthesis response regulator PhoP|nr:response regulator transcription factor [Deltaproteobacteria bacterium]
MKEIAKKILLVDDEPDITYIVDFVLKNGGFDVKTINDSTTVLDEIKKSLYDLAILDLMMPNMDGFTLLEKIRKSNKPSTLPVLILSSRQLSNEEIDFLKNNGASIMAKPFEPQRLLDKVREIVTEG